MDLEGEYGGAVVVEEEEATTAAEMERRSVSERTERIESKRRDAIAAVRIDRERTDRADGEEEKHRATKLITSAHERERRVRMGRRRMLTARIRYGARFSSSGGRRDFALKEEEDKAVIFANWIASAEEDNANATEAAARREE